MRSARLKRAFAPILLAAAVPDPRLLLSRADALIARGELTAALRLADEGERATGPAAPALHAVAEIVRGAAAEQRESARAAADHYARALTYADQSGNQPLVARAFEAVTGELYVQGEWDRVLALANARLANAGPSEPNRALYLRARGSAYSELHDPRAAGEAFDRALTMAVASGDRALQARLHRARGLLIWRYDRDFARAQAEYAVALDYGRRAHAWQEVVNALLNSANAFRNANIRRWQDALDRYQEALAIARREHLSEMYPVLLKNIGDVYRQQGDRARAASTLEAGMRAADRSNTTEPRWTTRLELAMLERDRDPARAERYFREALDVLDEKESDVLLGDLRAGALAGATLFADPFDEYIDFLVQQNRSADAFYVAERQRARVFLDTLGAARETVARTVPADFADAERRLLDRMTAAQAELREGPATETRRAGLLAEIDRADSALSDLRLRLAVERPSLALARYPRLWSVQALQQSVLASDEALVSLYVGARRSVAWIVTRDRTTTLTLPPRGAIEPFVRAALKELRDPVGRPEGALTELSRALRADAIAGAAERSRLVVIPHGILYDVPFDALPDARGRPLIERYATSYAPSASALAFLRSESRARAAGAPIVTVANPVMRAASPASVRQADLAHLDLLRPVPSTSDEARAIARLFGTDARVLEGAHATRDALEQNVRGARILHFATHGLIDEDRPERSALVLTADPPRDDGILQMRQIYGLHLDADLVTLSACETALGQNVTGEGIVGLTRAFFYAGARSVVASLWDVEDTATARLMEAFYARLRDGEAIDQALRDAKLAIIRAGGPSAKPFYWASFVATGQARLAVSEPPARSWRAVTGIACAALLIVAVLAFRRRSVPPVTASAA